MLLTIAVPVWNKSAETVEFCIRALNSIKQHVKIPYELIVVDNASPAHVNSFLAASFYRALAQHPAITITLPENIGFGPAVNMALKVATGKYFCQMNSDCELVEDSPSILIKVMETYGVDVAMPEHYENCQHYKLEKTDELMGDDWRFGAFWIIRTGWLRSVGGFDEQFELCYFEDTDLWKRLEVMGAKIRGWRGTWVKHKGGASALPNMNEIFQRNKELFDRKWSKS